MNIKRKIQLSAAAVVINGMTALILMAPDTALAATCTASQCNYYNLNANSICSERIPGSVSVFVGCPAGVGGAYVDIFCSIGAPIIETC